MNVLYITTLLGKRGGAEKNVFDLACNIDKERFTPYVICFKGGKVVRELNAMGVDARILDLEKLISFDGLKKALYLYRFIKRKNIEVVVTYHHDADLLGCLVARLAGVRVTISSRRDLGYQLKRKHVWAYRIMNRFFTRIVSVSEAVKKQIAEREWTDTEKIITVYNGVDPRFYECSSVVTNGIKVSLGIRKNKKVIGTLGAFRPVKGQSYLVRAVAEMREIHDDFTVLIVGFKNTEYYREVRQLISLLGLDEYFICTGARDDITEILSVFDIFVIPSMSEGFSNAVLEAMAAGKPVIATDVGGNSEAVIHNATGILVSPNERFELSAAMEKLLNDKVLRHAMGEKGRMRAINTFGLGRMIKTNENLYSFLIENKRPGFSDIKIKTVRTVRKSVKLALSYVFYHAGMASRYKKKTAKELKILTYHSINAISLRPMETEQDVSNFEQQMIYLKKNFQMLSLSDFLECRNNGGKLPENAVMVTFDDGYRDNYTNAYPILKRHSIPAVIFLSTGPLETGEPLFFDSLRHAVMESSELVLDLKDRGLEKYFIDRSCQYRISQVIKRIVEASKRMDADSKRILINDICERLHMNPDEIRDKSIYLSWNEISEMAGNGIEFGSHTVTHPQLSFLPLNDCEAELVNSKRTIEEHLGQKVRVLAYPFGGHKDFNLMVEKKAKDAGYECAFSLCQDLQYNLTDFTIGRKVVDSHMSSNFSGDFCKLQFETEMMGMFRFKKWHLNLNDSAR